MLQEELKRVSDQQFQLVSDFKQHLERATTLFNELLKLQNNQNEQKHFSYYLSFTGVFCLGCELAQIKGDQNLFN